MLAMPTAMFGDLMRVSGNESSVYNSSHAPRLQRRICSENTRSMCLIDIMSLSRVLFESLIYEGRPTTVFFTRLTPGKLNELCRYRADLFYTGCGRKKVIP